MEGRNDEKYYGESPLLFTVLNLGVVTGLQYARYHILEKVMHEANHQLEEAIRSILDTVVNFGNNEIRMIGHENCHYQLRYVWWPFLVSTVNSRTRCSD
jgi:hypothetical protein